MPGPKLVPLLLTDGERGALEALVRKRTASQALALRARIVLACAENGGTAPLTTVAELTRGAASTPKCIDFAQSCNNAFDQRWAHLYRKLASTSSARPRSLRP
jgi:hypothetical protein